MNTEHKTSEKLIFCHINPKYTKYLHSIDNKVPLEKSKSKERVFIGVLIKINDIKYFAPLSSAPKKVKDGSLNKKAFDARFVFKITSGKDNKKTFAGIKLNNMFPVLDKYVQKIDFNNEYKKDNLYASLLMKEMLFVNKHIEKIKTKAELVYRKVTNKEDEYHCYSCDFKKLEEALKTIPQKL